MRQQKVETKYSSIWMRNYLWETKEIVNKQKVWEFKEYPMQNTSINNRRWRRKFIRLQMTLFYVNEGRKDFPPSVTLRSGNPFYAPAVPFALSPHVRCLCRLRLSERKSMPRKLFTESLYSSSTSRKRRWKIFLLPKLIELARGASPKARNFLFLVSYSTSSARACHVWEASFESYRLNDTSFIRARQLRFYARAPFWRINFQLKLSDEDMLQPRTSHFAWYTRRVNPKESTGGWWRIKSWRRVWLTA